MLLTETKIKNAKPKEKMYRLADGDGLYLQVTPQGGKYWRFRYSFMDREKMLALGTYPEVSLSEARDKRMAARKAVAAGIDPGFQKKEAKRRAIFKAGNTFEALAKEWHDTNKEKWTADHAARIWRRLELHIFPEIGHLPVSEIVPLDVLEAIRKVEARDNTDLSRRLKQSCAAIFRFAIVTGRATHNPAAELRDALKIHKTEHYPTIRDDEIPAFLKKLEAANTSQQNKLAVRLLMLTFVRTGELRKAKWKDIDFKAKEWRIPADTTKMRRAHIVPLSAQAIKTLEELKALTGGKELLFPPQMRCRHPLMSENTVNQLLKRMGYKGKLVGHGFRSLASTTLNELGYPSDVVERQLSHKDKDQVRAAYNHAQYMAQRRNLMQAWADHIDALVKNQGAGSKVTKFRRPAA